MRVGLDAIPLVSQKTGIGHYTSELAQALARVAPSDEFQLVAPLPLQQSDNLPYNLRIVHAKRRKLWWMAGLPLYAKQADLELFHGTNYEIPLWACPTVLSIHDLSLLLYPETHLDKAVRRGQSRLPVMARSATTIITATEVVKREISGHLAIDPSKIAVTPYAPRQTFRPLSSSETQETLKRLGIEDVFVLFVGTIEPRKNLKTLLKAFAELVSQTELPGQLVIAGKEGWLLDDAMSQVNDRVKFTGYVTDEELCALYSSCTVFVYPSLYEGFGLPPLEAMACGAPVVTSNIPSITEVAGDAAELISPTDVQQLAHAIAELICDQEKRIALSRRGLKRAAEFTWERTALLTLEVYREALKKRSGRFRQ